MNAARPGRFVGLVFMVVVLGVIVALIAGYGIPVGVGALAGFVLGALAGLFGVLWLARGTGRTIGFGGTSWSSREGDLGPPAMAEMRERSELNQLDLGPTLAVIPILETADAAGYVLQLVAAEVRAGGLMMSLDVRSQPGSMPPGFWADVKVRDQAGTMYRASGQTNGSGTTAARYSITIVPAPPRGSRRLDIVIDRFTDPFPGGGRTAVGPWAFTVTLPPRDMARR